MIGSLQAQSFGFENLVLKGSKGQQRSSAARNGSAELSSSEQRQADQLKATDTKVRAHEQAHMAAGSGLVRGGASYTYETGPDKKRYAVGGEVSIDASPGRTPQEKVAKSRQIEAAALAPADPSPQDRRVAARASEMEMQAKQEMAQQAAEERSRADSERNSQAIGAYQTASGVERSSGFSAVA